MGSRCCSKNFYKAVFYFFQFVNLGASLAVILILAYILFKTFHFIPLIGSDVYAFLVYFLLSDAIVILVFVIVACLATNVCKKWLILVCILVFVFSFLIEISIGAISLIYKDNIEEELKLNLNDNFINGYNQSDRLTNAIDHVQENLSCCGAEYVDSWNQSLWKKNYPDIIKQVPDSCCITVSVGCADVSNRPSNINQKGCLDKMSNTLIAYLWTICGMGYISSILKFFLIVFGLGFYFKIQNSESEAHPPLLQNRSS